MVGSPFSDPASGDGDRISGPRPLKILAQEGALPIIRGAKGTISSFFEPETPCLEPRFVSPELAKGGGTKRGPVFFVVQENSSCTCRNMFKSMDFGRDHSSMDRTLKTMPTPLVPPPLCQPLSIYMTILLDFHFAIISKTRSSNQELC